jgi:hypothetical protein
LRLAKKEKKKGETYIERVRRKMAETQEQDTKIHKDRLKEKRLKKKRNNRDRDGVNEGQ